MPVEIVMDSLLSKVKPLWYKTPSILFLYSPILAPLYHSADDALMENILLASIFIGCACSIVWSVKCKTIFSRIAAGVLATWYAIFSFLVIMKLFE